MRPVTEFFINDNIFSDLDIKSAASRLSDGIKCKTINYIDPDNGENIKNNKNKNNKKNFLEFDKLHEIIKNNFKNIMANSSFEVIGQRALLIKLEGEDKNLRPCLLMAHQDVVPVIAGTEKDWVHDAFSGFIDDKYIWGRGALDIKQMLFGILEACEYILSHNFKLKRTLYLAFGDDEETFNQGAARIARVLEERGVKLEFLLDEGGGVIESGAEFGIENANIFVSKINLMEKGYVDLELSVESKGGHSSRVFNISTPEGFIGGTSLELLSRAISAICDAKFKAKMPYALLKSFEILRPYINKEPLKTLVQDMEANFNKITDYCLKSPELFPYVTTTIAPTMIEGGSAASNVMPQNMRAVINFRLNEGDTIDAVMQNAQEALNKLNIKNIKNKIKLKILQANNPSKTAKSDGYGYETLIKCLNKFYKNIIFIPSLTVGATDARCYETICDACLRFSPFMSDFDEARTGVHGTNERILIKSYAHGIKFLIYFIIKSCVEI